MELIVYDNTKKFLEDNRDTLESNALELNLMWRNVQTDKTTEMGLFAAKVVHENGFTIAIRISPFPMVLYAQGGIKEQMADMLIDHLQKSDFPSNINGLPDAVEAFTKQCQKRDIVYKKKHKLDLMICEKVNDVNTKLGECNYIKEIDYNLTDYLYGFHIDCNLDITKERAKRMAEQCHNSDSLLCYIVDGEVVSIAMLTASVDIENAIDIGYVYTPPKYRNKGYSTACVKELVSDAFLRGYKKAFLYAEDLAAISVYEKLGFIKIGDFVEYEKI